MKPILIPALAAILALGACASNISTASTLSNYDRLVENERSLVPVREFADEAALGEVTTIAMTRAGVAAGVLENSRVSAEQFERVVGTLSRTMCRRLARGDMRVVTEPEDGAHTLVLTITGFEPTNPAAAGASGVIGAFVPGPLSPRLPFGIGALAAEGELFNAAGEQVAAMQWDVRNHLASGPGTISILTGGLASTADGEDLAQGFADAFGDLIVDTRDRAGGVRGETERGTCTDLYDGPETTPGADEPVAANDETYEASGSR